MARARDKDTGDHDQYVVTGPEGTASLATDNPFADVAAADSGGGGGSEQQPPPPDSEASSKRLDEARARVEQQPDAGADGNGTEDVTPLGQPNPAPSPSLVATQGVVFVPGDADDATRAEAASTPVYAFEPPTNQDKPFGNRIDAPAEEQLNIPIGPLDVHEYTGGGTNVEEQAKVRRTIAEAGVRNPVISRPRHDASPVITEAAPGGVPGGEPDGQPLDGN